MITVILEISEVKNERDATNIAFRTEKEHRESGHHGVK